MDATHAGFLELVEQNEGRLRRISRAYGGPGGAADLYQEILVQLWRSLPTFRGESGAGTWLYRVALNTALSQRRRQASRPEIPLEPWHEHRASAKPRPDHRLEAKQRLERLYAAIEALPEVDRALVMMYLDECSYREMSEVLGISESNVGVKLHRIRKRLALELTEVKR